MQREMKEELARLKSELTFKQTEAEAHSLRKPPASARKKQTQASQLPPQTPVGNGRVINSVLLDNPAFRTPMRPPPQVNRYAPSPEVSRKSSLLPGFVNAFDQSRQRRTKPVSKASQPVLNDNPFDVTEGSAERDSSPNPVSNSPPIIQHNDDILMDDLPGVNLDASHNIDQEVEDAESDTSEDHELVSGVPAPQFHCNAELTRIVLTHTYVVGKLPTLQLLVESAASTPDFSSAELFSSSITSILEVLSNTSGNFAYEYSISILTRCLLTILNTLRVNHLIPPMISVLNLLTALLRFFPDFHLSLLSYPESESDNRSKISVLLCQIVIELLDTSTTHNFLDTLSVEVFNLLESLVWNVPQNMVVKLSVFCCNRELPSILFHTAQSHSFLSRSTRFLALLFSYPKMYEYCVTNTTDTTEDGTPLDFSRTLNLDRLCSLLIDVHRDDPDAISMKNHILMFFTAFSLAHSDALNLLASSLVFIPSLITHVAYLSRPIWEEEDAEGFEPQFRPASLTIRALSKTLSLLHHIVFNATPSVNLPDKFLRAHPRAFNGINHNFIVAFGRLSYAAAPDWVDVEERRMMTGMIEMATELLELVVDGPEGDGVWLMYHDGPVDEAMDEGEMEREVIGPDTALCQS
ncbi:hypothetical protein E1B28_000582 [Marasmius oreades]|nr:uncharacterized protein E1B28_000582 [Marasmius oreades]KAG7098668.1 hypothetical protein E1B28_000582 [Marasmius oreades]